MEIRLETGGVRFDRDVVNPAEPLQGLRPRGGLLTEMQQYALHQLRVAPRSLELNRGTGATATSAA
jgi:hypothetical protein